MKDWWLKLGCFLTGYNYFLLKNSSEASAKSVKKYLSAILIISILWAFIGYSFAQRYLGANHFLSSIVAMIMVIIVIQIERQIILSSSANIPGSFFRVLIAIVMSIIGSVIMDQIIFADDVEKQKIIDLQEEVDDLMPKKTKDIERQIAELDSLILQKENERMAIIEELDMKPFIKSVTAETKYEKTSFLDSESNLRDTLIQITNFISNQIANPKGTLIPSLENQINELRAQKNSLESSKLTIRADLENELKSKIGFLDELATLFKILSTSFPAKFVWCCFFIFFLSLELFVLMNKLFDRGNDYEEIIRHQRDMKLQMISKMA